MSFCSDLTWEGELSAKRLSNSVGKANDVFKLQLPYYYKAMWRM